MLEISYLKNWTDQLRVENFNLNLQKLIIVSLSTQGTQDSDDYIGAFKLVDTYIMDTWLIFWTE